MKAVINLNFSEKEMKVLRDSYQKIDFVITKSKEELNRHLADAEILVTFNCEEAMIKKASELKWIQAASAGVDFMPLAEIDKRGIILTNGKGIHKTHMSEYAIGAMIMLARNFHDMIKNQEEGKWDRSPVQGEINGATVGIIGLGSIGKEIAKKACLMGMKVLGVKQTPEKVQYVEDVYGEERMGEVFKHSDYIINLLPYTHKTHKLINRAYLNLMKNTACFIHIGRGKTVDEDDLIEALKDRKIRGLVADVFYEEPLPPDSPLWTMDNVILTPHICGESSKYWDRFMKILKHNIQVYINGNGDMMNLIDLNEGY